MTIGEFYESWDDIQISLDDDDIQAMADEEREDLPPDDEFYGFGGDGEDGALASIDAIAEGHDPGGDPFAGGAAAGMDENGTPGTGIALYGRQDLPALLRDVSVASWDQVVGACNQAVAGGQLVVGYVAIAVSENASYGDGAVDKLAHDIAVDPSTVRHWMAIARK